MRIRPIYSQVDAATPPSVRAPLDLNAGLAVGLQNVSGALDVVTQIAEQEQQYNDNRHLVSLTTDLTLELQSFQDDLSRMDYDQIVEIRSKKLDEIKTRYETRAGEYGGRVQKAWTPVWENKSLEFMVNTNADKTEKFRQGNIASGIQYSKLMSAEAVKSSIAGDERGVMISQMAAHEAFDRLLADGFITGNQAESWKSEYDRSVESGVDEWKREQERQRKQLEAIAKQEKAEQLENNYADNLVAYSQGKLTFSTIRQQLADRTIDPDKGKVLLDMLKRDAKDGPVEKNNPEVVGRLARLIGMKVDVSDELDSALKDRNIKSETYISMMSTLGNEQQSKGLSLITQAIAPGPADKWTYDQKAKVFEASVAYNNALENGEDAQAAAIRIVGENLADLRRSWNGLATPRFMEGDRRNANDIQKTKTKTVEAFRNGVISVDEFNQQASILAEHERLISDMDRNQVVIDKETDERIKSSRKK